MFPRRLFSILVAFWGGAGCSHSPIPQDITGSNTADIVARIRCETREAIRLSAIKEIANYGTTSLYKGMNGFQLAEWLSANLDRFNLLYSAKLQNKEIETAFAYFRKAQIGYEFTLNLNESNTQGVQFDLVRTFAKRSDTLGFTAKGERTRQTIRKFTVVDNFYILATKVKPDYCSDPRPVNLVYPTEGRLKIYDFVDSFIFINKNGSFEGTPTGPAIPTMGDTIVFSTKFTGSSAPSFALNPTQLYGFELSKFSLTNDNFREDKHQVIITATLPDIRKFPYYKSGKDLEFATGDPRIEIAERSIQDIRRKNVEDAIVAIGSGASRFFGQ